MSLSKSEMLHSAIHQMKQSEKRLFRMEINKLKKGSDYSKVFDYMSNTKIYDKEKFKKYFIKNKITSPNTTINYLFDKLITFLTAHRPTSARAPEIRHEISKIAASSETMYQLGFIRQSYKTRKKALKLALEHRHYDLAAYNFYFLFFTERQYNFLGLPPIELNEKTAEANFHDFIRFWSTKMELHMMAQRAVDLSNDIHTTEADWKSITDNPIFNRNINEFDFTIKILKLKIKSSYHAWNLEYEESIKLAKEMIAVYKENTRILIDLFENFLVVNTMLCISLYQIKHSDLEKYALGFEQLLNEFKTLSVDATVERINNIHIYYKVFNSSVRLSTLLLQESFTSQDVNKWSLDENTIKKLWTAGLMSIFFSAYMYLLLKEYDKFRQYIDILQNNALPRSFARTEWEMVLLSLIGNFEDNANIYFQNQLKNAIRRSKNKSNIPKSIIYMFSLLDKLRKTKSPQIMLKAALPEITALEPQRHTILHFSIWVKWRLKG